jgi:hypothetical protein
MIEARRNKAAILMLAMIVLPLCCLVLLQLWQCYWKHSAKERLEESSLQTLYLTTADIHWEKKGKELRIGKKLFDVKSIVQTPKGFQVTGIWDEQEMAIENALAQDQHHGSTAVGMMVLMVLFPFTFGQVLTRNFRYVMGFGRLAMDRICNQFSEIPYPPPRFS